MKLFFFFFEFVGVCGTKLLYVCFATVDDNAKDSRFVSVDRRKKLRLLMLPGKGGGF